MSHDPHVELYVWSDGRADGVGFTGNYRIRVLHGNRCVSDKAETFAVWVRNTEAADVVSLVDALSALTRFVDPSVQITIYTRLANLESWFTDGHWDYATDQAVKTIRRLMNRALPASAIRVIPEADFRAVLHKVVGGGC